MKLNLIARILITTVLFFNFLMSFSQYDFIDKYISIYGKDDIYISLTKSLAKTNADDLHKITDGLGLDLAFQKVSVECNSIDSTDYNIFSLKVCLAVYYLFKNFKVTGEDYENRANMNRIFGYYKSSIWDYTEALKTTEDSGTIYWCRAKSKSEIFDYYGAIEDYKKAINLIKPEEPFRYNSLANNFGGLGECYCYLKKFNLAIDCLSQAINYSNKDGFMNPEHYYKRGICYISINEIEKGCRDLSVAGENGSEHAYEIIKDYCK